MAQESIGKPQTKNLTVGGPINIPNLFKQLLTQENIISPGPSFPGRLGVELPTRTIWIFKSDKYMIFGCAARGEANKVVKEFEQYLKEVGLL